MSRVPRLAALVLALAALRATSVTGQTAEPLATACAAAGGDPSACAAAAVAGRQIVSLIGVMAAPGGEIPGEGSTLGRRLGGMPRLAAWVRGGVHPFAVPAPADPGGADDVSAWTPSFQLGLGGGVFDGFQLLPTMGGFLSLDVAAQASFLFLSEGVGFEERVNVYSVAARLGILRESFTLPGVTLSVARRFADRVRLGDAPANGGIEFIGEPRVTSLRFTASKDLYAVGVLVGLGWDDFSASSQLVAPDGTGGVAAASGSLDGSRRLYFASLTKQLGVLAWLTVEGGWASGLEPVSGYSGGFDPSGSALFGSLSVLLKL